MDVGRPWILVVPHPDDETLAAGVTIAEHVAAGRDVHILLLTRGTNTGAIRQLNGTSTGGWWDILHNPAAEGYDPLTAETVGNARYDELVTALRCLGVSPDRIHEASDLIGEQVLDSYVTVDQCRRAIAALVAQIGHPNPGVYAPSYVVDNNPDHIAAGEALRQLSAADPVLYADRRWYVLPPYWSDPRLGQVQEYWDTPTDAVIAVRARNACRAYAAWHPPHSYAIGYHSVASMFALVEDHPRSLLHR